MRIASFQNDVLIWPEKILHLFFEYLKLKPSAQKRWRFSEILIISFIEMVILHKWLWTQDISQQKFLDSQTAICFNFLKYWHFVRKASPQNHPCCFIKRGHRHSIPAGGWSLLWPALPLAFLEAEAFTFCSKFKRKKKQFKKASPFHWSMWNLWTGVIKINRNCQTSKNSFEWEETQSTLETVALE